jgi:hypothetical protein
MGEREVREILTEMLLNDEEGYFPGGGVRDVRSFSEGGLMTSNEGLVLKLADGSEFQIQILQSR